MERGWAATWASAHVVATGAHLPLPARALGCLGRLGAWILTSYGAGILHTLFCE